MSAQCPKCDQVAFTQTPHFCAICGHGLSATPPKATHPAAGWRRTSSLLIDTLVLLPPAGFLGWKLFDAQFAILKDTFADSPDDRAQWILELLFLWVFHALIICWIVYGATCEKLWHRTVGKRLLRIRVVQQGGGSITWPQAIGRQFARIVTASSMCAGFLYLFLDPQKRMFHDMLSRTIVVED